MRKIIEAFVKYSILSNILIATTVILGLVSALSMKKSFFPERNPRSISISVNYPGASPEEMEEGITLKIEQSIRNISGIDEITSTSSENSASVSVTTLKGYDLDNIYTEVKNAIDRISSFPASIDRPIITKNEPRSTVMWIGLVGDTDLQTLKKHAEDIKDELLNSGEISKVDLSGFPATEITIEVKEENLLRYGLTFDQVANAVRLNNRDISAGAIKSDTEEILIRSRNKKQIDDEIGEIILRANEDGTILRIRDIAIIKEQFAETASQTTLNGKPALYVRGDKLPNEDLKEISTYLTDYCDKFNAEHDNLELVITFNFMDMLQQRIDMLTSNMVVGLILVLISLGMFLSVRLSFWVAWGIPSSFLGMFIVAAIAGITVNMISLFGMILVVGILVDDGIVIAENIFAHFEKGKNPYQAAIDGAMEVFPAVMTSVTTTIVAFIPLMLLDGSMEFFYEMAFVVVMSLAFSLIEAFLVLPAHLASPHVLRSKSRDNKIRKVFDDLLNFMKYRLYGRALKKTIQYKWASSIFILALFPILIGLMSGGIIKSTFFPNIPFFNMDINVVFTPGTRETKVAETLKTFDEKIWDLNEELKKKYNDPEDFITFTFTNLGGTNNGIDRGAHAGSVTVFYRELDGDPIDGFQLATLVKEKIGDVPEAEKLTVGGNNRFGKPVSIKIMGKNIPEMDHAKEFLKKELRGITALKEVQDDNPSGKRELQIDLLPEAYFLGLNHNEITKQIRQGFFGEEVQRLQKGIEEVRVWVRYPKEGRKSLGQIEDMKIKVGSNEYPLNQLVQYNIDRGVTDIRHYATHRTVTVEAELIDPYGEVPPIMDKIKKDIIPELQARYPGISVDYGGQSRESDKSMNDIGKYLGAAVFVIFLIIMLQFRSFYQAIMIMAMIPLGWIGALFGHGIVGLPVSMFSGLGMVALSGVIINDAVVFLDAYNRNLRNGMDVYNAAFDAGLSRFRPIMLTSVTTVAGLMPLILETSFQAQFLIPMAVSVAFGVLIGTFIILLYFPVLILIYNSIRRTAKALWTGEDRPSAEEVERVIIDMKKEFLIHGEQGNNT